ncbi:MAG: hypothetical protein JO291_15580 [Acidimicrobiia bacterium]|nr:hypothetical protein [Acidimicrobiia bacterium]
MGARVRATDIEDDVLPRICVVTGEECSGTWRVRYDNPPGALWLLLLFGIVPFVIARLVTRHVVEGLLPISSRGIAVVRTARRHWRIGSFTALGVAVASVVVAVELRSPIVAAVGLGAAFVVWCVTQFRYVDPVRGSVEQSGRWVRLTGTHPAFDRAVAPQNRVLEDGATGIR